MATDWAKFFDVGLNDVGKELLQKLTSESAKDALAVLNDAKEFKDIPAEVAPKAIPGLLANDLATIDYIGVLGTQTAKACAKLDMKIAVVGAVAIVAIGGCAYLWYRVQQQESRLDHVVDALGRLIAKQ